jgi:hypothetical protein
MNLILMGYNQVAFDSVCCHVIGIDPREVEHIRLAHERGFGPIDLDQIRIEGDVSLEEARRRAEGFQVGLVRVEKYFEGTNITAYAGPPPGHGPEGYCWGGCPGVMEEMIEILRLYDENCDAKLPKVHLVFGKYRGPIDISYGEKVVFIGDCVEWEGKIAGELVQITSKYKERTTLDPHFAKHEDIYAKMLKVNGKVREAKKRPWIRLDGCPVSVAELVMLLAELGNIQNPYFDKRQIVGFNKAYLTWRAVMVARRLRRLPYQVAGTTERGAARPNLPPAPDAE